MNQDTVGGDENEADYLIMFAHEVVLCDRSRVKIP
jgi:hypothetical protein